MKKILIIAPDKKNLEETSNYLKRCGFEVVTTKEGSAGVQKALEIIPDIILCDNNTPVLNGYEVFHTLQQINTTAVIPFIFLTNDGSHDDIRAVMNLGIDNYIIKPFELEHLLDLIEIRLEKQAKIKNLADEKFNNLMEYAHTGIFIYQNEKLSYVNKKFCEIVGYPKKELIGMSLVNIIYKDDIQIVIDKISRCFKGIHKDLRVEFRTIY